MGQFDALILKHNGELASIAQKILNIGTFELVIQAFTATSGQTLFELTGGVTYDTDQPAWAYDNGTIQIAAGLASDNFTRTSTSSFTMSAGVTEGHDILFFGLKVQEFPGSNIVTVTTDKTLALADNMTYQNATGEASITVPPNSSVAFPIGAEMTFFRDTASEVDFVAGDGVTIKSDTSYLKINAQNTSVYLKKVATDTWHLSGSLKA